MSVDIPELPVPRNLIEAEIFIRDLRSSITKIEGRSRARSLVITKLQEAGMWMREAISEERPHQDGCNSLDG